MWPGSDLRQAWVYGAVALAVLVFAVLVAATAAGSTDPDTYRRLTLVTIVVAALPVIVVGREVRRLQPDATRSALITAAIACVAYGPILLLVSVHTRTSVVGSAIVFLTGVAIIVWRVLD